MSWLRQGTVSITRGQDLFTDVMHPELHRGIVSPGLARSTERSTSLHSAVYTECSHNGGPKKPRVKNMYPAW